MTERPFTMSMPTVTATEIAAGLCELGLPQGCVVLVHSSLKSFGYVEGGPHAVIEGIRRAIGPDGTIVVPTLTFGAFARSEPYIDLRETRAETGIIPETLCHYPGALRSIHPTSSVAALGPLAAELVRWHHDTPCDTESPYGKVFTMDGWILFLGAGFSSNSLFHVAEEIVSPDYLGYHLYKNVHVTTADGSTYVGDFRRYNCTDRGIRRYLANMEQIYEQKRLIRCGQIGNCRVMLLSARDNVLTACEVLRNKPEFILNPLTD
jgi:aminoglycoside 3-N-acetyltransferase